MKITGIAIIIITDTGMEIMITATTNITVKISMLEIPLITMLLRGLVVNK